GNGRAPLRARDRAPYRPQEALLLLRVARGRDALGERHQRGAALAQGGSDARDRGKAERGHRAQSRIPDAVHPDAGRAGSDVPLALGDLPAVAISRSARGRDADSGEAAYALTRFEPRREPTAASLSLRAMAASPEPASLPEHRAPLPAH